MVGRTLALRTPVWDRGMAVWTNIWVVDHLYGLDICRILTKQGCFDLFIICYKYKIWWWWWWWWWCWWYHLVRYLHEFIRKYYQCNFSSIILHIQLLQNVRLIYCEMHTYLFRITINFQLFSRIFDRDIWTHFLTNCHFKNAHLIIVKCKLLLRNV